mgnify:FL=1
MEEHQKGYIEAGMNACVTKPIDRGVLVSAIDLVMGEDIHIVLEEARDGLPEATPKAVASNDDEENLAVKAFLEEIDVTER